MADLDDRDREEHSAEVWRAVLRRALDGDPEAVRLALKIGLQEANRLKSDGLDPSARKKSALTRFFYGMYPSR